jgi:hypothetical protein
MITARYALSGAGVARHEGMSQRLWRRFPRPVGLAEATENGTAIGQYQPNFAASIRMSASQARRLFGTGVSFQDDRSAKEYAARLSNLGYSPIMLRGRGRYMVFRERT